MKDRTISPGPRGAAVASAAVLLAIGGATIGSASAVTPPAPAMPTNVEAAAAPRAYPAVHAAYAQYVDLLAPVAGSRKYLVFIRSHVVDPSRGRLKGGMFVRYRSGEVRRIWTTTDQLYDAFLSGPMVVRPNCVKDSAVPVVTHPGNCSSGDRPVIDWYNLETHEAGRVQLSDRLASEEFAGAAPNGWTAVIRS